MKRAYRDLLGAIIANDYTCKEIAAEIGIAPQTLSSKIHGTYPFTLNEMIHIGNILSFDKEDITNILFFRLKSGKRKEK